MDAAMDARRMPPNLYAPLTTAARLPPVRALRVKGRTTRTGWFVYLVRCPDGTLYCGITNKLLERVATHNSGQGAKYTRSRRPVVLVWSKKCRSKSEALKTEYATKQLKKRQKETLVHVAGRRRGSKVG